MRRLFLDANVIFTAAHNAQGNGRALFSLAEGRWIDLLTSRYALDEAVRNLALKYPRCVSELDSLAPALSIVGEPTPSDIQRTIAHGLPPKDAPILAAAIAARASALVTGDRRHFGALFRKSTDGVLVLTPAEALSRALKSLDRSA